MIHKISKKQPWMTYMGLLLFLNLAIADSIDTKILVQNVVQDVCDKQLVVLAELPTHGEALGFQAKADMVQHLVEQCDFKALFFEAPLYDFLGFQQGIENESAQFIQLNRAIGGFWNTKELRPWQQWLLEQSKSGQLIVAGLDDQVSATSDFAKTILPQLVGASVNDQDASKCQQALERNLNWHYDDNQKYDSQEKNLLQKCTQQAADKITNKNASPTHESNMVMNVANYYARNNAATGAISRDEMLYKNFVWQHKILPKNVKVIIWTSTVHATRQQGELKRKPTGVWLAEQWQDKMAVIGFTAYKGESSMAGNPIQTISTASADSLEAMVLKTDSEWLYLNDFELNKLGSINSRLYGQTMGADWGSKFDGVVVFHEEKAPNFYKK